MHKFSLQCTVFSLPKRQLLLPTNYEIRGLVISSNKEVKSACGTVISESQRPNFSLYCYYLFDFILKLSCALIGHYIVLYFLPKKTTSPAD